MNIGGGGMRFRDVVVRTRNGYGLATSKFCLRSGVSTSATIPQTHRTHFKDTDNLIEAQHPGSDRVFLFLGTERPRDSPPSTLLHNLSLDLVHGPVVGNFVNRTYGTRVTSSAHVVSSSIAPSVD